MLFVITQKQVFCHAVGIRQPQGQHALYGVYGFVFKYAVGSAFFSQQTVNILLFHTRFLCVCNIL